MSQYIASIPNPGIEGAPKILRSDDTGLITRWIKAEDRPGFSIYDCPNPLKPGATTHGKDSVSAIRVVYVDIDFKDVAEAPGEIDQRLADLLLTPTETVDSGHGRHVKYELKEEVACDDPDFEQVCALQAQLIEYFAADPQVRPWSLLRRVGTTNSKQEPHVPCRVLRRAHAIDLTELRDLCDLIEGAQLLTRKPKPEGNGHDHTESVPPSAEAKAPVDVDTRLADMRWRGSGDSAINVTQRDTMASLLRHHIALDEATTTVLEATRRCVAGDPEAARWDWQQEELNIAWNGARLINKDPTLVDRLPDDLRLKFKELDDAGRRPSIRKNKYGLFVSPARGPSGHEDGVEGAPEPESKKEIVRKLLLKDNGTTVTEVLEATGWQTISMPWHARACGLKLLKYKEDGVTRYKGLPLDGAEAPAAAERPKADGSSPPEGTQKTRASGWNYFDSTEPQPQRWCVKQLIPETGVGIVAGQWGSFKTTAALDLSVAVMSGQPFAGQYRVKRSGAILYFATEGAGTLQSRLAAIARHRGAPDKLPFAWRGDCPPLTDRDAGKLIVKSVDEAAIHFEHAYAATRRPRRKRLIPCASWPRTPAHSSR